MIGNIGGVGFGGTIFNKSTALFAVAESFSIGSGISSTETEFIDSTNIQNPMLMGLLGGLLGGMLGGLLGRLLGSALGGGMQVGPFSLSNGVGNIGLVGGMNPMISSMPQMNPQGINNQSIIMLLMILLMMLLNRRGNNGGMNMIPFGNNGNGNVNFNPLPAANCGSCGNPSIPSINGDKIRKLLEELMKRVDVKELEKKLQEKRDDGLEWECGTSRLWRKMREDLEKLLKKLRDKEKIKININISFRPAQAPGCVSRGPIYKPIYKPGRSSSGDNNSKLGIMGGEPAYSKAGTGSSGTASSKPEINNLVYYRGYDNVRVIEVAYGRGPIYSKTIRSSDLVLT